MGEFDEWAKEQQDAMGEVAAGLVEGDLGPLAAYFRAGYYEIEPALARELADMIDSREGYTPYRLQAVGRSKRPGGWAKASADRFRQMQIGVWVEKEVRAAPRGAYPGIIEEACERFGVKKTTVTDAHRECRRTLETAVTAPGFDLFEHYLDIYSDDIPISPDQGIDDAP